MHELHFQFSKLYYGLLLEILRFLFGALLWETPCISFFLPKTNFIWKHLQVCVRLLFLRHIARKVSFRLQTCKALHIA